MNISTFTQNQRLQQTSYDSKIPDAHRALEKLAHTPYGKDIEQGLLTQQDIINMGYNPTPTKFQLDDLNAYVFYPTGSDRNPAIAFSGSRGIKDLYLSMTGQNVSSNHYSKNEKAIEQIIDQVKTATGKNVDLVGHSLGGSLAEMAAADIDNINEVHEVVKYQAPSAYDEYAKTLYEHNIPLTNYSVVGDWVSGSFGGNSQYENTVKLYPTDTNTGGFTLHKSRPLGGAVRPEERVNIGKVEYSPANSQKTGNFQTGGGFGEMTRRGLGMVANVVTYPFELLGQAWNWVSGLFTGNSLTSRATYASSDIS